MGVYHITYSPELKEVCLYFNGGCNFRCHGCISKYHPEDCHLDEAPRRSKNRSLSQSEVISYLQPLSFKRVIFLGWEPTVDSVFLPLAKTLKEKFSTFHILITNGWKYVDDEAIDEVCVSIKAITQSLFKDFTGRDNPARVLRNFERYANNPLVKLRAESVFIPGYIHEEEIGHIARFIASINTVIPYRIDAYIPINAYFDGKDRFRRPTQEEMEKVREVATKHLKNVSILTSNMKVKWRVERVY